MATDMTKEEWDALSEEEKQAKMDEDIAGANQANSAGQQAKEAGKGLTGQKAMEVGGEIKDRAAGWMEDRGWDFWNSGDNAPIVAEEVAAPEFSGVVGTGGGQTQQFDEYGRAVQGRTAAQATAAQLGDTSAVDTTATQQQANQSAIIGALQNRAAGNAPSAAELQLARSADRNIAAARAQAAGQYGVSAGQAARTGGQLQASALQDAAGQAAVLRAQEQAGAEQALVGAIQGARGQDLQFADLQQARVFQQAGMDQQTIMANLQSEQGQRAMNDQMTQYYMSQGYSRDDADRQALIEMEKVKAEIAAANADRALAASQAASQLAMQEKGGKMGLLGTALTAFSDKRMKKDIKSAKREVDGLLSALKSYSFKYKDNNLNDNNNDESQIGIMAQDAEKSDLGKSFVDETEEGKKYLSGNKALGAILASLGRLAERMDEMDSKKKKEKN